jgi:hypothetical protein
MSKRPRAETSVSAQPSTRVRVEEPETTFTLFDDADLKELELSIFDGQLSECSTLSDKSTLTFDSSDNSEYEVEEPAITGKVPSGNWTGTRYPRSRYHLPRMQEDLRGPELEDLSCNPTPLDNNQKRVTKTFCDYLIKHWPSERLNAELTDHRHMGLADPTTFCNVLLKTELPLFITIYGRQPTKNRSEKVR